MVNQKGFVKDVNEVSSMQSIWIPPKNYLTLEMIQLNMRLFILLDSSPENISAMRRQKKYHPLNF